MGALICRRAGGEDCGRVSGLGEETMGRFEGVRGTKGDGEVVGGVEVLPASVGGVATELCGVLCAGVDCYAGKSSMVF